MVEVVTLDSDNEEDSITEIKGPPNSFDHLIADLKNLTQSGSKFEPLFQTLNILKERCAPEYMRSAVFKEDVEECRKGLTLENCMLKIRDLGLKFTRHKCESDSDLPTMVAPRPKRRKLDATKTTAPITSSDNQNGIASVCQQELLNKVAQQLQNCTRSDTDKTCVSGSAIQTGNSTRNKEHPPRKPIESNHIIILPDSPPPLSPNHRVPSSSDDNSTRSAETHEPRQPQVPATTIDQDEVDITPPKSASGDIVKHLTKILSRFPDDHDVTAVINILVAEITSMNFTCGSSSTVEKYCKILVKLKSAYSILFHLLRLLRMEYFSGVNPVHISRESWAGSDQRLLLADFVMLSLFERLLYCILPKSRKPTVDLFRKKFASASASQKGKIIALISEVDIVNDSDDGIKGKAYKTSLLRCLGDCMEVFINVRKKGAESGASSSDPPPHLSSPSSSRPGSPSITVLSPPRNRESCSESVKTPDTCSDVISIEKPASGGGGGRATPETENTSPPIWESGHGTASDLPSLDALISEQVTEISKRSGDENEGDNHNETVDSPKSVSNDPNLDTAADTPIAVDATGEENGVSDEGMIIVEEDVTESMELDPIEQTEVPNSEEKMGFDCDAAILREDGTSKRTNPELMDAADPVPDVDMEACCEVPPDIEMSESNDLNTRGEDGICTPQKAEIHIENSFRGISKDPTCSPAPVIKTGGNMGKDDPLPLEPLSQDSVDFVHESVVDCLITSVKKHAVKYVEVSLDEKKASSAKDVSKMPLTDSPIAKPAKFTENDRPLSLKARRINLQIASDSKEPSARRVELTSAAPTTAAPLSSPAPAAAPLSSPAPAAAPLSSPVATAAPLSSPAPAAAPLSSPAVAAAAPLSSPAVAAAAPLSSPAVAAAAPSSSFSLLREEACSSRQVVEEELSESGDDVDVDENAADYKEKVARVGKLSRKLVRIARRIKAIQEADIDTTEMGKWGNLYKQEGILKKKHRKILEELEDIQGDLNVHYCFDVKINCGIPKLSKYIEDRLNARQKFPDIEDIRRLIVRGLAECKLTMKENKIKSMARQVFLDAGSQIQTHRRTELRMDGGFHLMDQVDVTKDPAKDDAVLRQKLKRNRTEAKEGIKKIQERFEQKQLKKEFLDKDIFDDDVEERSPPSPTSSRVTHDKDMVNDNVTKVTTPEVVNIDDDDDDSKTETGTDSDSE